MVMLAIVAVTVGHPLDTASADAPADDDELFVMVGRRVPSFGGAYVDQGGTLRVWLTEPRAEAARQARDALVEIVGEGFAVERLAVLEAKYSWLDLRRWYVAMRDIHQVAPDLVFTDMDEARNRITIALEDPDRHRAAVEAELDRLGIPGEAVNIEQSAPIQQLPTSGRGSAPFLFGLLALVVLAAAALLVRKRRAASAATP
jgi:LPXTG-motif cell wall-anchored protein